MNVAVPLMMTGFPDVPLKVHAPKVCVVEPKSTVPPVGSPYRLRPKDEKVLFPVIVIVGEAETDSPIVRLL